MIRVSHDTPSEGERVLTAQALDFVSDLHRLFDGKRCDLLSARTARQARIDAGELPHFAPDSSEIRGADWAVSGVPADLQDRRVEITGPVERKMMINALNSGAKVFMADFEDSNSPTWRNVVEGQSNLIDAVERTIAFDASDGRQYRLAKIGRAS